MMIYNKILWRRKQQINVSEREREKEDLHWLVLLDELKRRKSA